jgi:hypothetical protein
MTMIHLPSSVSLSQMNHVYQQLLPLLSERAPFVFLLPGQRQALGGRLFANSDMMVCLMAQCLMDNPELFAEAGEDGKELMADFETGEMLDKVIEELTSLLAAARDTRVAIQSRNVARTMGVIEYVKEEEARAQRRAERKGEEIPAEEIAIFQGRRLALCHVLKILDGYYDSLKAKKKARKEAAEAGEKKAVAKLSPVEKATQERKDAVWLRFLEAGEDRIGAGSGSTTSTSMSTNTSESGVTPPAFSAAGARRQAVLDGDRRLVMPRKRTNPRAYKPGMQMLAEYMAMPLNAPASPRPAPPA